MRTKIILTLAMIISAFQIIAAANTPKIAIIGAGIAGLTAGPDLKEHGFDVSIYEARGRVGGRSLSAFVNGSVVELGGQNIYDCFNVEDIHALLEKFGLITSGR